MNRLFILLVASIASLTISQNSLAEGCTTTDGGHPGSGYVGYFEKGKSIAFCRQVGDWGPGSTFVRCSIVDINSNVCELPKDSKPLADSGYPNSSKWEDANGDGFIDFCRRVGDGAGFTRCNLGPDFGKEKDEH